MRLQKMFNDLIQATVYLALGSGAVGIITLFAKVYWLIIKTVWGLW